MTDDQAKKRLESLRVLDALVESLMHECDADLLQEAARSGLEPYKAQQRVATALNKARSAVAEKAARAIATRRPPPLSIDASRARAILKRVAAGHANRGLPWAQAAQLRGVASDAEALEMVAALKDLGVIADKDLE